MSYKSILVHVDDTPQAGERGRIAAQLALANDAHLIGLALTQLAPLAYFVGGGFDLSDASLAAQVEASTQAAQKALVQFEAMAKRMGVSSFERRLDADEAWAGFSLQARYCDLAVVGQTDVRPEAPGQVGDFAEYVLMNNPRPTLVIPAAGQVASIGQHILIGWNASMEAARAVAAAIPLLRAAQQVELVVLNAEREPYGVHGAEPGADIALYLARHGVKINVSRHSVDKDVGDALISCAADHSSDLIVMGAYGHSRFREMMLGGATRAALQSMPVPVLLMR